MAGKFNQEFLATLLRGQIHFFPISTLPLYVLCGGERTVGLGWGARGPVGVRQRGGGPWEPWTQWVAPWPETVTAPEPGGGGLLTHTAQALGESALPIG
jgi:hypothetical protein